jgi:hypothetical protein
VLLISNTRGLISENETAQRIRRPLHRTTILEAVHPKPDAVTAHNAIDAALKAKAADLIDCLVWNGQPACAASGDLGRASPQ